MNKEKVNFNFLNPNVKEINKQYKNSSLKFHKENRVCKNKI